ncbi:MAG TPA: hypothetical protein VF292_08615 [Rhodanobacteraceae bacterium]
MPIHFPLIVAQAIDTSAGTDTFHEMVHGVCGFIRPIVDKGNVVSLLLVMVVLVMAFLWYFGRSPEDLGGGGRVTFRRVRQTSSEWRLRLR